MRWIRGAVIAWVVMALGCASSSGTGRGTSDGGAGAGASGDGGASSIDPGFDECKSLAAPNSYIGCEYWPTVTSNAFLTDGFAFAVVVSNAEPTPAQVRVTRGDATVAEKLVPADDVAVITLPWVDALKNDPTTIMDYESGLHPASAYRLRSSVPVTVYQFNPLEFALDPPPEDCLIQSGGLCKSSTNDASLLLPKSALSGEYYVLSYPSHLGNYGATSSFPETGWHALPGFTSIVATEDATTVEVTAGGKVRAGQDVPALEPGEKASFNLGAGDVLSLFSEAPEPGSAICSGDLCTGGKAFDLTGTHIVADKPVSVIAGHDCTMVPFDQSACDHLEESMLPVKALGTEVVASSPVPLVPAGGNGFGTEAYYLRVLSAADDNFVLVSSDQEDVQLTMDEGQWTEVGPLRGHARVIAQNKILVAQYLVGEEASAAGAMAGDPSLTMLVPVEQYRNEYAFYVPQTFRQSFVDVLSVGYPNAELDGVPIAEDDFEIAATYGVGREEPRVAARLSVEPGMHRLVSDLPIGLNVYGYGDFTSYAYPGGLELAPVVITPR